MTDEQYAEDLRVMIAADREHLAKHIEAGDRVLAKGFVDSLIDNGRELARMERRIARCQEAEAKA